MGGGGASINKLGFHEMGLNTSIYANSTHTNYDQNLMLSPKLVDKTIENQKSQKKYYLIKVSENDII